MGSCDWCLLMVVVSSGPLTGVSACSPHPEPGGPEELQQAQHVDARGAGVPGLLHGGSPQVLPPRDAGDRHRPYRQGRGRWHLRPRPLAPPSLCLACVFFFLLHRFTISCPCTAGESTSTSTSTSAWRWLTDAISPPSLRQVHRLVLVDSHDVVRGIVSLSDLLQALVLSPAGIDALYS